MAWPYKHFSRTELACPCCGTCDMDEDFLWKLEALRRELGVPMVTTSAYRCEKHEAAVGGSGANHPTGKAWDGQIRGLHPFDVMRKIMGAGFTGIGLRQHGSNRFYHLDTSHEIPTVWTYE